MFATPAFLIAAAAGAAIPLLLHLMQNRRKVSAPFPTLRFLKLAEKQSSRRIRLENILLWLIRTLIMALLGLAFAMPMLRSRGLGWLGNAPRDVAIVIDASYSMDYNTGRETVWNKTIDTATAIIEGLNENDRLCLFLAREQPEALIAEPVADKEGAVNRLKNLEPGTGSSQLAPAVTEALKALKKEARGREREIFIVTDGQALAWSNFAADVAPDPDADGGEETVAASSWDPELLDDDTAAFVTMLGVPAPENVGPDTIELRPPVVRPGSAAQVIAGLQRTGQASESALTLFINGEQVSRQPIRLNTADAANPSFPLPPLPPGLHSARIDSPDDNLPVDNSFHFLIRVADQLPTLTVGPPQDTLFVRTALRAGAGPDNPGTQAIPPEDVPNERLEDYACVFLCNALPISGQALEALEDYVHRGGLLVLFPGTEGTMESYKAWTCLPGFPSSIEEVPWSNRSRTLMWDQPQHLLVRPLREGAAIPSLILRRRLAWTELHEDAESLISTGAEEPFLIERAHGDGRVLMFSVAADRSWSDFPLSPFYLPLILQSVDYSAGFGSKAPFMWTTDSFSLSERFPRANRSTALRNPDNKPVPIRSTVEEGRTTVVAEDLVVPGIYTMTSDDQPVKTPALAVNIRRAESDLTPIPQDTVADRLGVPADKIQIALDLETLELQIEEHRVGRTYGEHLLWIALILVIIEFFYANALLRSGPRLSDQLHIDASGSVKGHIPHG